MSFDAAGFAMSETHEAVATRDVASVEDALVILSQRPMPHTGAWTHRIARCRDKIASGDVRLAAEVARELWPARAPRRLGLREWELYWDARRVLETALRHRLKMSPSTARRRVDAALLASGRDGLRRA